MTAKSMAVHFGSICAIVVMPASCGDVIAHALFAGLALAVAPDQVAVLFHLPRETALGRLVHNVLPQAGYWWVNLLVTALIVHRVARWPFRGPASFRAVAVTAFAFPIRAANRR